jgi:hypothetical protein
MSATTTPVTEKGLTALRAIFEGNGQPDAKHSTLRSLEVRGLIESTPEGYKITDNGIEALGEGAPEVTAEPTEARVPDRRDDLQQMIGIKHEVTETAAEQVDRAMQNNGQAIERDFRTGLEPTVRPAVQEVPGEAADIALAVQKARKMGLVYSASGWAKTVNPRKGVYVVSGGGWVMEAGERDGKKGWSLREVGSEADPQWVKTYYEALSAVPGGKNTAV